MSVDQIYPKLKVSDELYAEMCGILAGFIWGFSFDRNATYQWPMTNFYWAIAHAIRGDPAEKRYSCYIMMGGHWGRYGWSQPSNSRDELDAKVLGLAQKYAHLVR